MNNQTYVQYDPQDIQQTRTLAWISYLGLLFLIPMFVYRNSPYTKFHVNQGIVLCIFEVAVSIILRLVGAVLGFVPIVGRLVMTPLWLAYSVLSLVLTVLGIVNAATGKAVKLPVIGGITIYR